MDIEALKVWDKVYAAAAESTLVKRYGKGYHPNLLQSWTLESAPSVRAAKLLSVLRAANSNPSIRRPSCYVVLPCWTELQDAARLACLFGKQTSSRLR